MNSRLVLVAVAACLAAACATGRAWGGDAPAPAKAAKAPAEEQPTEYQSQAIIEVLDPRPIGERDSKAPDIAQLVTQFRIQVLTWSSIREIILSRKVDFGEEVDPDNLRQIERLYDEIGKRTKFTALGNRHIAISYRSSLPERNAALVNELVKRFIAEDRREHQLRAKEDLKYYRDKLAVATVALADIENQIREFNQQNPWLGDGLEATQREYEQAEARQLELAKETKAAVALREELGKQLEGEAATVKLSLRDAEQKILGLLGAEVVEFYARRLEAARRSKAGGDLAEDIRLDADDAKLALAELRAWLQKIHGGLAALRKKGGDAPKAPAKTDEESVTVPNPRHAMLKARVAALDKRGEQLAAMKLEQNKRVSELYVRRRKAPELLGERKALEEQRPVVAAILAECTSGVRAAEKEMQRLLSEAHSSRFRVVEYARDDRRPVKGGAPPGPPAGGAQRPSNKPPKPKADRPGSGAFVPPAKGAALGPALVAPIAASARDGLTCGVLPRGAMSEG